MSDLRIAQTRRLVNTLDTWARRRENKNLDTRPLREAIRVINDLAAESTAGAGDITVPEGMVVCPKCGHAFKWRNSVEQREFLRHKNNQGPCPNTGWTLTKEGSS